MEKDFFNSGILGSSIGLPDKRGFRSINTEIISKPAYNPKYFEAFPTVWANAFAFKQSLVNGDIEALEEWTSLFLLHYIGKIHLVEFTEKELGKSFDNDLWPAYYGTYPRPKGDNRKEDNQLQSISILQIDDKPVVGAYYPEMVFFPGRNREGWETCELLKYCLADGKLSWKLCYSLIENETETAKNVHKRLRSIAKNVLQNKELKEHLEKFCENKKLPKYSGELEMLDRHPRNWDTMTRHQLTQAEILKAYPLKKKNEQGGTTYYLVDDIPFLPLSPWLTKAETGLPAPSQYESQGPRDIVVKHAGKTYTCDLGEKDVIVQLKELFLEQPYWCKIPRDSDDQIAHIRLLHSDRIKYSGIRQEDKVVCLAPLRKAFFQHFSEIFENVRSLRAESNSSEEVVWRIPVGDKEIVWKTMLGSGHSTEMPKAGLSIWPPKTSKQWALYAAYGTGNWRDYGRWHLIDENGRQGQTIDLEDDEYVSVLHPDLSDDAEKNKRPVKQSASNRPRTLLFTHTNKECGVLFLADMEDVAIDDGKSLKLSVDFGTSNTCLAINSKQEGEILRFSLSPLFLWGRKFTDELPGFVPNHWGGYEKGFFPTMLYSRKSDSSLPYLRSGDLKLEHLFKVDIPSLHKDVKFHQLFLTGAFTKTYWRNHMNLKWSSDSDTAWRSLFLELILLYSHGEIFFNKKAHIKEYVFTYPLAYSKEYGKTYHDRAKDAIRNTRHRCYNEDVSGEEKFRYLKIDESRAIANSVGQAEGTQGMLEVFIDVGGGTADIAIRHRDEFLVLDSIRVAGEAFFNFANKNLIDPSLIGSKKFKEHLGLLFWGEQRAINFEDVADIFKDRLGAYYSVEINEVTEKQFNDREDSILKQKGEESYQRYRSRLFFRHLFAYALLQACATTIAGKLSLNQGIKLILGGNCWGLLLFAGWKRESKWLMQEANTILKQIVLSLENEVRDEEKSYLKQDKMRVSSVEILNEEGLGKAKHCVAIGALQVNESELDISKMSPYTGITVRNLKIDEHEPSTIRWCDRYSIETFKNAFVGVQGIEKTVFEHPIQLDKPYNSTLAVFSALGNPLTIDIAKENMPKDTWVKVNSALINCINHLRLIDEELITRIQEQEDATAIPINYFLSRILYWSNKDFLDDLAKENRRFK